MVETPEDRFSHDGAKIIPVHSEFEPQHGKPNTVICAPGEESDQAVHSMGS